MKFSIIINKWTNFYFFVQNLSESHPNSRKDYNVLWRRELGKFSTEEEGSLKRFKEIRLKYLESKSCFEKAFFLSENPLEELTLTLLKEEYQIVRNTFSLLENKFNSLYEKDLLLLNRWQETLDKVANNQKLTETILVFLNALYKTSVRGKEVNVYLLFSNQERTGGGANIDNQSISVEVSNYPLKNIGNVLGVIWHETTHLLFQNHYFYPLVLQYFHGDQKTADFINEIVISSLFPRGILGIRLLKNKPPVTLSSKINPQQTIEILNLIKKYIDQKMALDENYIAQLHSIIKK